MLQFNEVLNAVRVCGVVDFDWFGGDKTVWFDTIDNRHTIIQVKETGVFFTVWQDENCDDVVDNIVIDSLDTLNACLNKYAITA